MPFVVCVPCLGPQFSLPEICEVYLGVHKTGIIAKKSPIYHYTVRFALVTVPLGVFYSPQ